MTQSIIASALRDDNQFLIKELLEGLDQEEEKYESLYRKFTYGKATSDPDNIQKLFSRDKKERPPSNHDHDQQKGGQSSRFMFRSPSAI